MNKQVEIYYSVECCRKNYYNKNTRDGRFFDNLEDAKRFFKDCTDMPSVKAVKLVKETKCPADYQISRKGCNVKYVVCHRKKTNNGYDNEQFFKTMKEANAFYNSILPDVNNYVFIKKPVKIITETIERA